MKDLEWQGGLRSTRSHRDPYTRSQGLKWPVKEFLPPISGSDIKDSITLNS